MTIKRYASFSYTGEFTGFFSSDVHKEIPKNSIEISSEKQEEMFSKDPFSYRLDLENGILIEPENPNEKKLEQTRTQLKNQLGDYIARCFRTAKCDTGFGWEIDCRRWNHLDDYSHMQVLLNQAKRRSLRSFDQVSRLGIRGADNEFHKVTVKELKDKILPAMETYQHSLLEKKWETEKKILEAVSEEDLEKIRGAITWK